MSSLSNQAVFAPFPLKVAWSGIYLIDKGRLHFHVLVSITGTPPAGLVNYQNHNMFH